MSDEAEIQRYPEIQAMEGVAKMLGLDAWTDCVERITVYLDKGTTLSIVPEDDDDSKYEPVPLDTSWIIQLEFHVGPGSIPTKASNLAKGLSHAFIKAGLLLSGELKGTAISLSE